MSPYFDSGAPNSSNYIRSICIFYRVLIPYIQYKTFKASLKAYTKYSMHHVHEGIYVNPKKTFKRHRASVS